MGGPGSTTQWGQPLAQHCVNQTGEQVELVVLPRVRMPAHCPVTALQAWLDAARIVEGPVYRADWTGKRPGARPLNPGSVNALVQDARRLGRAGPRPLLGPQPAGGLRHLRPSPWGVGPGHRPPDPSSIPGHPRSVRDESPRLGTTTPPSNSASDRRRLARCTLRRCENGTQKSPAARGVTRGV